MNNLENATTAELINICKSEASYLANRSNGVIDRYVAKNLKNKNYEKIWIENSIITHEKNEFLGIYCVKREGKKVNSKACFFGVRYVRGLRQFFYLDGHGLTDKKRAEMPITLNDLVLINQHVIERYVLRFVEKFNLNLSDEEILIRFLMNMGNSASSVSYLDNSVEASIEDGILLGEVKKDGTIIYKTFVNKLFENQRMNKYNIDRYNKAYKEDEERKNKRIELLKSI